MRLYTLRELENMGYRVIPGEVALHLDRHGNDLFRADQVEYDYHDEEEESEVPDEA